MRKIRQNPTPQRVPVIERVILLLMCLVKVEIVPSIKMGRINIVLGHRIYCFLNFLLKKIKGGKTRENEANKQKHLEHNPKLESHIQKQRDGI